MNPLETMASYAEFDRNTFTSSSNDSPRDNDISNSHRSDSTKHVAVSTSATGGLMTHDHSNISNRYREGDDSTRTMSAGVSGAVGVYDGVNNNASEKMIEESSYLSEDNDSEKDEISPNGLYVKVHTYTHTYDDDYTCICVYSNMVDVLVCRRMDY